jgi:4-amino-4-deoxy-L-arabinose transferase-like glycosyltransferase
MTSLTVKGTTNYAAIIPVAVTIVFLVPFVGKAFHIDDPLFIWSAKQIQVGPANFYGFAVNWRGTETPMAETAKNPPGACYYIALVGSLFGWREITLHIAFLIPAVAAVLGTYYLAKQFCSRPVLAALAMVLTPVFLVSSTNIMCDTMMLSLWVWAVVFWVRGIKSDKQLSLFFAAVLIAICALTKYFGMTLLGLLFVYALIERRKLGTWVLFLLIPVAILAGYQWVTHVLYGRGLLSNAAAYAIDYRWKGGAELISKGLMGLAFTGGCLLIALFYTPLLWSRRILIVGAVVMVLLIFDLAFAKKTGGASILNTDDVRRVFLVQVGLMAVAGMNVLGLAVADFWKCRSAESLLLLLWVLGTFIFAGFVNWTVNARSILPMVPATGILLMRRLDQRSKTGQWAGNRWAMWPLVPAAFFAVLVCWADYTLAGTARNAAKAIHEKFENQHGNIWFQGHWGFQYYMEAANARAIDFKHSKPASGDIIIIPENNTCIQFLSEEQVRPSEVFKFVPNKFLATMNPLLGAGFYSDIWGPLPFAVGPVGSEKYLAFTVK